MKQYGKNGLPIFIKISIEIPENDYKVALLKNTEAELDNNKEY